MSHVDFTDAAAADERRLTLAAKVHCVPDEWCDEIFPRQFPAVLRARLRGGRVIEERVAVNRGGPGNPLSADELRAKFLANSGGPAVFDAVLGLPSAPDVRRLMALVMRPH